MKDCVGGEHGHEGTSECVSSGNLTEPGELKSTHEDARRPLLSPPSIIRSDICVGSKLCQRQCQSSHRWKCHFDVAFMKLRGDWTL